MNVEKATSSHNILDIGGGNEWNPHPSDLQRLHETVAPRAVSLAKRNPDNQYIIFDSSTPSLYATKISEELPNVHFVNGIILPENSLPFSSESFDYIEMNHMFTPIAWRIERSKNRSEMVDTYNYAAYFHVLKEASRVLKPRGKLAITEKYERLHRIFNLLSDNFDDLDEEKYRELGFKYEAVPIPKEVRNSKRSEFTQRAFKQAIEFIYTYDQEVQDNTVYTYEFVKTEILE
jgi:hypothetical protein